MSELVRRIEATDGRTATKGAQSRFWRVADELQFVWRVLRHIPTRIYIYTYAYNCRRVEISSREDITSSQIIISSSCFVNKHCYIHYNILSNLLCLSTARPCATKHRILTANMYSLQRWCTAIPVLSTMVLMVHGATIKFDQSQTGDYNLQIHLKNIELYAVFDDSGGSDDEVSRIYNLYTYCYNRIVMNNNNNITVAAACLHQWIHNYIYNLVLIFYNYNNRYHIERQNIYYCCIINNFGSFDQNL